MISKQGTPSEVFGGREGVQLIGTITEVNGDSVKVLCGNELLEFNIQNASVGEQVQLRLDPEDLSVLRLDRDK